jgi:copper chaperone NosL
MKKLSTVSRIAILISALLMVISFFVPVWQILMWAPQYPEGLEMKIWLNTITGDYKIISGLNHYIGMKHIDVEMFPEFRYMIYIVGGIVVTGILAALINKRWMLISYMVVIFTAAAAGLVDFYLWGYDYGHNLDPTAPIVVPGMAYQPPLLGTKQLLNFTAYSGPDIGGYVFLVCGILAASALIFEMRASRKMKVVPVFLILAALYSCAPQPEPLQFGRDGCHFCKMTLMDRRFGAELVTEKGKVYKFDDISCMMGFYRNGELRDAKISHELIVDYAQPGNLINARTAIFVSSENVKSPMAANVAAFSRKDIAEKHQTIWQGALFSWDEIPLSK